MKPLKLKKDTERWLSSYKKRKLTPAQNLWNRFSKYSDDKSKTESVWDFPKQERRRIFFSDTKRYKYHAKTICLTSDRPGYRNQNGSLESHNFIREVLYVV